MAIQWGTMETSGGNGIRVGIEVDWDTVYNSSPDVDATIKIYTDNEFSYNDSQTLTYGGHISGSTNFTNNDGSSAVLRATKTYRYTYNSSSYGSSPGTRTFSASLSGAFNGVTPSKSVTVNIPARPYAAPNAPTSASASRISDTLTQVAWQNNATAGRPWTNVHMQASVNGGAWTYVTTGISGSASVYNIGASPNQRWQLAVAAVNSIGGSGWAYTGYVWTSPATPTISTTLTDVTNGKRISWTNNVAYAEYQTVVVGYKDGVDQGAVAVLAAGVTSFDHLSTSNAQGKLYTVANKWKYYVYAQTTSGPRLYSGGSSWTQETTGTTVPPLAPTNLKPSGITIDPTAIQPFTWLHKPGADLTAQTKYQVRHRIVGTGTWTETAEIASATSQYNLPANTYASGTSVEWQVRTWGTNATAGPYSATATYQNTSALAKMLMIQDRYTGEFEASSLLHGVPTGSIVLWATATPPVGWLICNGGTFDATAYPQLNTLLGGNTLPDLRDRTAVGVSGTKAVKSTGGSTALPEHAHALSSAGYTGGHTVNHTHNMSGSKSFYFAGGTAAAATDSDAFARGAASGRAYNTATIQSGSTGGASVDHAHYLGGATDAAGTAGVTSTQNPYVALNYIIRAA